MNNTIALVSDATDLRDGTYEGLWSAYTIRIVTWGETRTLTTRDGARSLDGMPVVVTVANGHAVVTEL